MSPNISFSLVVALLEPTSPFTDLSIEVILDSYILPSLISTLTPFILLDISCPNAPYSFVLGSINDNVPIPDIVSLTYNPVLITPSLLTRFIVSL